MRGESRHPDGTWQRLRIQYLQELGERRGKALDCPTMWEYLPGNG
jgi:hypothetical protein